MWMLKLPLRTKHRRENDLPKEPICFNARTTASKSAWAQPSPASTSAPMPLWWDVYQELCCRPSGTSRAAHTALQPRAAECRGLPGAGIRPPSGEPFLSSGRWNCKQESAEPAGNKLFACPPGLSPSKILIPAQTAKKRSSLISKAGRKGSSRSHMLQQGVPVAAPLLGHHPSFPCSRNARGHTCANRAKNSSCVLTMAVTHRICQMLLQVLVFPFFPRKRCCSGGALNIP